MSSSGPIRVMIVDDEPPAVERMIALLTAQPGFEVVACESRSARVAERCKALVPDLVLLDIEMPGLDGLDVARALAGAGDDAPSVVFVSAHESYAVDAFGVAAVDYLVKPVREQRLRRALERVRRLRRAEPEYVAVHIGERLRRVALADVRAFTAEDKSTLVHALDGRGVIDQPLRQIEQCHGDRFVRVHRNALVSRAHLRSMCPDRDGVERVELDGLELRLEVSRRNRAEIRRLLTGEE